MSYLVSLFLTFVNFCVDTFQCAKNTIIKKVNAPLEGYVIYYALYSKEDKHCVVLYDYRSFLSRLYLIGYKTFLNVVYKKNLHEYSGIFKYESVVENMDNLSHFFVDCVVVAYVKNQEVCHDLYSNDTNTTQEASSSFTPSFVYAVLDDNFYEHDFTLIFNRYLKGILESKQLTCHDLMVILCNVTNATINLSNFTLKCMLDTTFEEIVFKGNDTISSKIRK